MGEQTSGLNDEEGDGITNSQGITGPRISGPPGRFKTRAVGQYIHNMRESVKSAMSPMFVAPPPGMVTPPPGMEPSPVAATTTLPGERKNRIKPPEVQQFQGGKEIKTMKEAKFEMKADNPGFGVGKMS